VFELRLPRVAERRLWLKLEERSQEWVWEADLPLRWTLQIRESLGKRTRIAVEEAKSRALAALTKEAAHIARAFKLLKARVLESDTQWSVVGDCQFQMQGRGWSVVLWSDAKCWRSAARVKVGRHIMEQRRVRTMRRSGKQVDAEILLRGLEREFVGNLRTAACYAKSLKNQLRAQAERGSPEGEVRACAS
jgi:hypothetical protein